MDGKLFRFITLMMLLLYPELSQSQSIVIDKPNLQLFVIEGSDTLFSAPVCVGSNFGDKVKEGDQKTPEGVFSISEIQNSSKWKHDFGDGNGEIRDVYGPWFFRLSTTKWTGIGIHGTCFPESIGKRESGGCVRLKNEDLIKLKSLIKVGMKVVVTKDEL